MSTSQQPIPVTWTSWAVALIAPVLVVVTIVGFMVLCHISLGNLFSKVVANRVALSTERAQKHLIKVLGQADSVLESLHRDVLGMTGARGPAQEATALSIISANRPGISLVSWTTTRGEHMSLEMAEGNEKYFRRIKFGDNERLEKKLWVVGADGKISEADLPTEWVEARSDYAYKLAVEAKSRIWTKPYTYRQAKSGISCAEPIYDGDEIKGVIAITFDLRKIGDVIDKLDRTEPGYRFIFTDDREIVGIPSEWMPSNPPTDRTLTISDLKIPIAWSYFSVLPDLLQSKGEYPLLWLSADSQSFAVSLAPITTPNSGDWHMGVIIPRTILVGKLDFYQNLVVMIGLGLLAISGLMGIWKFQSWRRNENALLRANLRAQRAEAKAQELGAYDLVKLLGKGGMGEVWLAQHRMLARPAAIKLIKSQEISEGNEHHRDEMRKRFAFEAKITAQLTSRNTVQLYDYGISVDGTYYYVMELLDGIDVRQLVVKYGAVPARRVVDILIQACRSLAEAHDAGLVHRDIKPENLFICRRADELDVLKVLDFGIVRTNKPLPDADHTQAGMVKGTPTTMSPEQITNQKLDGRSDLYSLGCVAYWMLTGHHVFECENMIEMMTDHVRTQPTLPRMRTSNYIPPELEALIMRLLSKNPKERPENAYECEKLLKKLDLGSAKPWGPKEKAKWWETNLPPSKSDVHRVHLTQRFMPRKAGH